MISANVNHHSARERGFLVGTFASLSGTSNEITVTHGVGTITLSTPQAIATTSSVQFQQLTLGSVTPGGLILQDTEVSPKTVQIEAPATLTNSYVLKLPWDQASGTKVLQNDGAGNLSWASGGGSGTVNSGTTNQIGYYASNGDVISGASASAILNILGFVTASQSISGTGYYTLPGGLILQWVTQSINSGFQNDINFPTAFPNNCFAVIILFNYYYVRISSKSF